MKKEIKVNKEVSNSPSGSRTKPLSEKINKCENCNNSAMSQESRFCKDCVIKHRKSFNEGWESCEIRTKIDSRIKTNRVKERLKEENSDWIEDILDLIEIHKGKKLNLIIKMKRLCVEHYKEIDKIFQEEIGEFK